MLSGFLQSDIWEKFQQALGKKTFRVNGQLLIKNRLPLGLSWLYSPRCSLDNFDWQELEKIAQQERAIFSHFDHITPTTDYQLLTTSIQPQKTLVLDLTPSTTELLTKMKEKTRYNIRLASKKQLIIERSGEIEDFWRLINQTTERQQFIAHYREYYQKMIEIIPECQIWTIKYYHQAIAAAIFLFSQDDKSGYYLHGGSDYHYRQLMAPYLLQWAGIQEAQKRHLKFWDFWGVDERRWPGVTRFKTGFGGRIQDYPPAVRLIYRPFCYRLYTMTKVKR